MVIFDESRHQQTNPLSDTYNLAYYFLVYFTNDWMAMLILFLALFMMLEVVLIRKEDPEDWRHVFVIIYYGFGDAKRCMSFTSIQENKTGILVEDKEHKHDD